MRKTQEQRVEGGEPLGKVLGHKSWRPVRVKRRYRWTDEEVKEDRRKLADAYQKAKAAYVQFWRKQR